MEMIKANRFEQAVAEMESLDVNQLKKLNEEIDVKDSKHYHVALITIVTREGQAKNSVKVNIQKFHEAGFKKLEKNFKFYGFTKLIVLHDPTITMESVEKEETKTIDLKPSMTEQEMEAEIEKRAQEKFDAHLESIKINTEGNEGNGNDDGDEQDDSKKKKETFGNTAPNPFENGDTVKAMKEFAEKNGIDLTGLRIQGDIKSALITWQNEQNKENKQ